MKELNEVITKITDTIDDAGRLYGEHWDSALVGGETNYHAVTSEHTQDVVVRAADDSLHSSWLCDYLEAVSPANVRQLLTRIKEPVKGDETRQIRDLVMMVKLLARTVKKYNPNSRQARDFTAYLEREGLISAADCLRDGAKDPE